MGMYVYKMFNPGLVCRGYQFKVGVNECEHATCVKEGFHAAENPLDCLSYYSEFDKSECWLCYASGDVHEDGSDSKISCTHLEILRRLNKQDFVCAALQYVVDHPKREISHQINRERGEVSLNGFAIVMGQNPLVKVSNEGDVVGWIKTDAGGDIVKISMMVCTAEMVGKWFNAYGREMEGCD